MSDIQSVRGLNRGLTRQGAVVFGSTLVLLITFAGLFAPWIVPYSPYDLDVAKMLKAPSWAHWLGTDEVGRDVLSRTIYAARISVTVAIVAVGVGFSVGTAIGVLSAYVGGAIDLALMRLMELLFSFPAILLAIILMASLGTSTLNAMLAIGIIFIPGFARLARASTMAVLRHSYIDAAKTVGMSDLRIILREILPNILAPSIVEAMAAFAYAILLESALSFLGLGAQPPEPSWGNMINIGRGFMAQAPWLSIVPGMALFLFVMGFNLVGDGLRDLFDPHLG